MSDQDFDARLLDLLYGELPPDEAKAVQAEVNQDPVARKTLEAWGAVREAMVDLPMPEPDPQVHYNILRAARAEVEPAEPTGFFAWLTRFAMSPAFAGAAAVMVLAVGSLVYFNQEDAKPDSALDEAANVVTSGEKAQARDLAGQAASTAAEAEAEPAAAKADEDKGRFAGGEAPRKSATALGRADALEQDAREGEKAKAANPAPKSQYRGEATTKGKKALPGSEDRSRDEGGVKDAPRRENAPKGGEALDGFGRVAAVDAPADATRKAREADKNDKATARLALNDDLSKGEVQRAPEKKRRPKSKKARVRSKRATKAVATRRAPAKPKAPVATKPVAKVPAKKAQKAPPAKDAQDDAKVTRDFAPPPPAPVPAPDDLLAEAKERAADQFDDGAADEAVAQPETVAKVVARETRKKAEEVAAVKPERVAEDAEEEERRPIAATLDADGKVGDTIETEGRRGSVNGAVGGMGEGAAGGDAARGDAVGGDTVDRDAADDDGDLTVRGGAGVPIVGTAEPAAQPAVTDARAEKSVQPATPRAPVARRNMPRRAAAEPAEIQQGAGAVAGPAMPAELQQARAARRRGDHRTAVTAYSAYFDRHPGHGEISRSLFEAARSYEALGDVPNALRVYRLIRRSAGSWYTQAQARIQALRAVQAEPPKRPAAVEESTFDAGERVEPKPEPPPVDSPVRQ